MKKLFVVIVMCLFASVNVLGEEAKILTSGDYEYVLLDNGTAEIIKYIGQEEVLNIPEQFDGYSVTTIGDYAFEDCSCPNSITLPDSITTIEDYAFRYCGSLSSISLPNSINYMGSNPFTGCENVKFNISPDHPYLAIIDGVLFRKPDKCLVYCPNSKDVYEVPDGIQYIGDSSFSSCYNLTSISLPDSVTTIGDYAFSYCNRLSSISLPDSINNIGSNPFQRCENVKINISPDHPYLAEIDGVLFSEPDKRLVYCPDTKNVYEVPGGIQCIGDSAFESCESLSSISLPDSITTIGDLAFATCHCLKSISLPDSITTIGDSAFYLCTSLNSIILPDSIIEIGDYVFNWCTNLGNISLPDSLTTIGVDAFYGCEDLIITVSRDSYAAEYCEENGLNYTYPDANDWLNN